MDVYDLLSQSVRDTQYSLQHPGVSSSIIFLWLQAFQC